jgi:peptidyl-prolyl cis-trans isomerase C
MVPAFDKVVFNEKIGELHGPVPTPFGNHLILIESRED